MQTREFWHLKFLLLILLILILGSSLANVAKAQDIRPTTIADLESMAKRPSVEDLKRVLNPWPEKNPWESNMNSKETRAFIMNTLPPFIAELEKAFPGGTYGFLGRDAVAVADVVDAFYRSQGQNSRVVRLGASGDSIRPEKDMSLILGFLDSNGLTKERAKDGPPFVLLDGSYLSESSQMSILIRAFYQAYAQNEEEAKEIAKNVGIFNMVAVGFSTKTVVGIDTKQVKEFLRSSIAMDNSAVWRPKETFGFSNPSGKHIFMNEFTEWHYTFGRFRRTDDGRVVAPPGHPNTQVTKKILGFMYEAINATSTEDFFQNVKNHAKKIGYDFEIPKPQCLDTFANAI